METQYISLNMTPTGVNPCFHISQYDVGRMLGFIVHSGGATVDLDTYTCTIEATRSDGTAITSAVATTDNIGTFAVTPTMSNKADKYRCQLVIVDENSKRIASLPFDIEVTKAAMDENSEAIEEDASLYQQYTESVQSTFAEVRSDINDLSVFVTPEMYGAKGDGITDDTKAIEDWLNSDLRYLIMLGNTYKITRELSISKSHVIIGNGGTIVVSDSVTPSDNFLIKFHDLNSLIIDNVNFSITAVNRTPFVDDRQPNHDGILLKLTNVNNAIIKKCNFYVLRQNSITNPCTPIWFTGTCDDISVENCVIKNLGYAQSSGCVWFYGTITNAKIDNCLIIGSTIDELIITWGGTNDLLVTNCTINSLAKNDQMVSFAANTKTIIDNCVMSFASNVVNYRGIKCIGGEGIIKNSTIYYHTTAESFLLSTESGNLKIFNCDIYLDIQSNNNGGLLIGTGGNAILVNNNIVDIGSIHCSIASLKNGGKIGFINNHIVFPNGGIMFYMSGFDELKLVNNSFLLGNNKLLEYTISHAGDEAVISYSNSMTGGVSSRIANQNPSLKSHSMMSSKQTPSRISNGGSYDFDLPDAVNHDTQVGLAVIRDVETGSSLVGSIELSAHNAYRFHAISTNADYTVSVVDNKLRVVDKSIYGGYVSATVIMYNPNVYTC